MSGGGGYRFLYRLGLRPWEFDRTPPELVFLADHPEPAGGRRALDLGCGTGRQAIDVARRGWEVVGVDFVPRAVEQARTRSREAGVDVRFLVGDVTELEALDLGAPFDLVYDNKCFHGLPDAARLRYAEGVSAVCRPGGLYLLFALTPSRVRSLLGVPGGVSRAEVSACFCSSFYWLGWRSGGGEPFKPACYWMRRRPEQA